MLDDLKKMPLSVVGVLTLAIICDLVTIFSSLSNFMGVSLPEWTIFVVGLFITVVENLAPSLIVMSIFQMQRKELPKNEINFKLAFSLISYIFIMSVVAFSRFTMSAKDLGTTDTIMQGVEIQLSNASDGAYNAFNVVMFILVIATSAISAAFTADFYSTSNLIKDTEKEIAEIEREIAGLEAELTKMPDFSTEEEQEFINSVINYRLLKINTASRSLKKFVRKQLHLIDNKGLDELNDPIPPMEYVIDRIDQFSSEDQKQLLAQAERAGMYSSSKEKLLGASTGTENTSGNTKFKLLKSAKEDAVND